jgi:pSer/pThr/pTyr-binding forkhead associated (FHA) protein
MALRLTVRSAEGRPLPEELRYDLEQDRVMLGRSVGADVRLPHATVSEQHAIVRLEAEGYVLVDGESTNGTRVNGDKVVPGRKKKLHDGDRIDIGVYSIVFEGAKPSVETVTAERTAELARRLFRASQRGSQIGGARLVLLGGPQIGKSIGASTAIPEPPAKVVIGRAETCQLILNDPDVSREHAEVVRDLDGVTIRNLESKNGVIVQGNSVQQRRLRDGDEIMLGKTRLLFEEPADQMLLALANEADRLLPEPSAVETKTSAASKPPETLPSASEPRVSSQPSAKRPSFDADLVIYSLAAVIIAISVAGILFLMRSGQ